MLWLTRKNELAFSKKGIFGTLLLIFLAVTYTTPWDSYLIKEKIWTYAPGNVLFSIYRIPIEEYFFFVIQTIIGCLFTAHLLRNSQNKYQITIHPRRLGIFPLCVASLIGLFYMMTSFSEWQYFNLIVVWALPIILLQWFVAGDILLKFLKPLAIGVCSLTLYFWIADSVAIHNSIWSFPENSISGWTIARILPIEEALFFVVTNIMVVQGYILFTQADLVKSSLSARIP